MEGKKQLEDMELAQLCENKTHDNSFPLEW